MGCKGFPGNRLAARRAGTTPIIFGEVTRLRCSPRGRARSDTSQRGGRGSYGHLPPGRIRPVIGEMRSRGRAAAVSDEKDPRPAFTRLDQRVDEAGDRRRVHLCQQCVQSIQVPGRERFRPAFIEKGMLRHIHKHRLRASRRAGSARAIVDLRNRFDKQGACSSRRRVTNPT